MSIMIRVHLSIEMAYRTLAFQQCNEARLLLCGVMPRLRTRYALALRYCYQTGSTAARFADDLHATFDEESCTASMIGHSSPTLCHVVVASAMLIGILTV